MCKLLISTCRLYCRRSGARTAGYEASVRCFLFPTPVKQNRRMFIDPDGSPFNRGREGGREGEREREREREANKRQGSKSEPNTDMEVRFSMAMARGPALPPLSLLSLFLFFSLLGLWIPGYNKKQWSINSIPCGKPVPVWETSAQPSSLACFERCHEYQRNGSFGLQLLPVVTWEQAYSICYILQTYSVLLINS